MNKKIANNLNMATTPMLQFIRPPVILDIGGDIEKFIEESEKFFELTQTYSSRYSNITERIRYNVHETQMGYRVDKFN